MLKRVCMLTAVFPDLFNLQPVAPDPLQQVTETCNQGVFLNTGNADFSVAQLHSLTPHLLYQHTFSLQRDNNSNLIFVSEKPKEIP